MFAEVHSPFMVWMFADRVMAFRPEVLRLCLHSSLTQMTRQAKATVVALWRAGLSWRVASAMA